LLCVLSRRRENRGKREKETADSRKLQGYKNVLWYRVTGIIMRKKNKGREKTSPAWKKHKLKMALAPSEMLKK